MKRIMKYDMKYTQTKTITKSWKQLQQPNM